MVKGVNFNLGLMDTELRKRLEEAQTSRANQLSALFKSKTKTMFEDAFKLGYKEAIAQGKEWLKEHFFYKHHLAEYYWESKCDDMDEALANFESDMNKLWEEQK